MTEPVSDTRSRESAFMIGRPGELMAPDSFPLSNVVMAPNRYSYEGNWLYCTFPQPDILAARIGFGRGKFDWEDYGLNQPVSADALFYRIEIITPRGLYSHVFSDSAMGRAVDSNPNDMDIALCEGDRTLFRLTGWPRMHWYFESPGAGLSADLVVSPDTVVLWPDFIMPRNTFAICIGACLVRGTIRLEDSCTAVDGAGFYDHPRIVVEPNPAPPFGWYLYAPVRFADGTRIVSYYVEDGLGSKDQLYSAGFLIRPDGRRVWLTDSQVRHLRLDEANLPVYWQAELKGEDVHVSYRVEIAKLTLARGWGDAGPDAAPGKYAAFPLLMAVEGACNIGGSSSPLESGLGVAEFLLREGYQPRFP